MPELVIDNREIAVPKGTKIIDAAEKLGIMIPRFCYHRGLGAVGACRVCAVKFVEGPFKGVQMSCMIDAKDGMVVSTTDEEAVEFRKYVIEWLMLHHPHDCPVCDEGGHCLLQDMTVAGGHGIRRYQGKKRTYHDQYLGPLLQHEMNRCIQCYRCSRFYQEFAGYRDLGVMQIAFHVYFGRREDGILESPFAGNVSDLCPTGVFTDKPSRYIGRRWDYERSPSLCINCCLGCHTVSSARYREVVRLEARYSETVNGYFICDRGRYGFYYASHPERPRQARSEGKEVPYDQAVQDVRERMARISEAAGPNAVACVGSGRNSLETQAMLKRLCTNKGYPEPIYFADHSMASKAKTVASRLEAGLAVSLRELEQADFILAVGVDPINEAPMLALAMRQAQRAGGKVFILDSRPVFLPVTFQHLPLAPDEVNPCLGLIVKDSVERGVVQDLGQPALEFFDAIPSQESFSAQLQKQITAATEELRQSQRPVIVCGTQTLRESTPAVAADCAVLLKAMNKQCGLFYLMEAANSFGATLLSQGQSSFTRTVEAIESGEVKALLLVEADPLHQFSDRQRLNLAMQKLELLVVLDYVNSQTVREAHIFLPTSSLYEAGGIFVNQEGRVQLAPRAYLGGTPITQVGGGSHPPRIYGAGMPGSEPRPAWQILSELVDEKFRQDGGGGRAALWSWLGEAESSFADLPPLDEFPDDGVRVNLVEEASSRFAKDRLVELEKREVSEDVLELFLTEWTFGTEELSVYSPHLAQVERAPCLFMHTADASRLGLSGGDNIAVSFDGGVLQVNICVAENIAQGVMVLPRHRQIEWQKLKTLPTVVRPEQIEKVRK